MGGAIPKRHRMTMGSVQEVFRASRALISNLRDYLGSEMEYVDATRFRGSAALAWNHKKIAQSQEKHWPTLVRNLQGPGPLGVAHFPWSHTREDRTHHNAMMSYGYVLARASRNKTMMSILDWGGGAGHYYLYSKALLPEVAFDYHCVDVPMLCEVGRKLLPEIRFHEWAVEGLTCDLVISSSSLHYAEDWRGTARKIAASTREFLYLARVQTVFRSSSFVALHRPRRAGYPRFFSWCLNRQEVIDHLQESNLELLREFVYAGNWHVRGAPEKVETRGFLFRRKPAIAAREF